MRFVTIGCALVMAACGGQEAPPADAPGPGFNIDPSRISTSGISSGGFLAGQLHLAHSDTFSGVAVIAGGPWWCAQASLQTALGACINGEGIDVDALLRHAAELDAAGAISPLGNVRDDRAWLFLGAKDAVVAAGVIDAAADFYGQLVAPGNATVVLDVPVAHGFPTLETGVPCDQMASPFLNACDYDAAGELLAALHGPLRPRTTARGEILAIRQPGAAEAGMLDDAMLYVPTRCAAGEPCGIHVALHGCQSSTEFIGEQFVRGAGFNEWAEANDLLILYPQVAKSRMAPMNPLGCWDWWGYTGDAYATRNAPQIVAIMATIEALSGRAP